MNIVVHRVSAQIHHQVKPLFTHDSPQNYSHTFRTIPRQLSSQVSAVLMISLWLVYIGMSGTDGSPMDLLWDFQREFIGKNITFENMGNVKCIWNYYKSDFDHGNITLSYYQKFVSETFQIILMGTLLYLLSVIG